MSESGQRKRLLLARPAAIRFRPSRTHRESHDGEKFGAPREKKKKAGGHYAADLVLQLPSREVRFRC
ncbi:hypothetical protein, partial [Bradyrhizobium sp. JYMT SZCCT0180]|uniref:hypothetical protein n=1 Tax=Bradyrhizobium sp. JYMT SZCCT0180 TaxID=2807666 RepID=UPI001BA49DEE